MQKLSRAGFKLPETITAKSCQDGFHFYFRHNNRVELGTLGKGVDVKHAGYVVAPPTRWSGNDGTYSWLVAPFGGRLQEAPEWVLKRLIRPPAPKYERTVDLDEGRIESRIAGAIERIAREPEGSRNFILNTCAYHIRRYSLATDMSREVLFACEQGCRQAFRERSARELLGRHLGRRNARSPIEAKRKIVETVALWLITR